ncbi:hypothetical protein CJU89_0860 [Yarrowia sp. B02]|nr:hypothetical protein CJU89_0860 [Yarrowia sp. B02]
MRKENTKYAPGQRKQAPPSRSTSVIYDSAAPSVACSLASSPKFGPLVDDSFEVPDFELDEFEPSCLSSDAFYSDFFNVDDAPEVLAPPVKKQKRSTLPLKQVGMTSAKYEGNPETVAQKNDTVFSSLDNVHDFLFETEHSQNGFLGAPSVKEIKVVAPSANKFTSPAKYVAVFALNPPCNVGFDATKKRVESFFATKHDSSASSIGRIFMGGNTIEAETPVTETQNSNFAGFANRFALTDNSQLQMYGTKSGGWSAMDPHFEGELVSRARVQPGSALDDSLEATYTLGTTTKTVPTNVNGRWKPSGDLTPLALAGIPQIGTDDAKAPRELTIRLSQEISAKYLFVRFVGDDGVDVESFVVR